MPPPPAWKAGLFTVGVTGTNGKTSTTAWIAAALRSLGGPVLRATTVGSFLDDERVGVASTYRGFLDGMKLALDAGGRFTAIELTSEALAVGFARAWPCEVGVFTNLSHDHLDAHGSPEHYLASKAQLFLALPPGGTAVLNAADPAAELLREVVPKGVRVRSYAVPSRGAVQGSPDIVAARVSTTWEGTHIACEARDPLLPRELRVRSIGDVNAENALAALLGAVAAGVAPEDAARAIAEAPPPPGRFEVIHERPWVVVDYAHGPDALRRTVTAARQLTGDARLFAVFGAGGKRDKDKRAPMGEAARAADHVILTTDNPRDEDPADIARAIARGLAGHPSVRTILDRAEAIGAAIAEAGEQDVVLIAGKGHETAQTIGRETRRFDDAEVASQALRSR